MFRPLPLIIRTLAPALFALSCDGPAPASTDDAGAPASEPARFVELLTFSVDADEDEALTLLDEIGAAMATKDGFQHRILGHSSASDTWLILNYWDSSAAAANANVELLALDTSMTLNEQIDPSR